MPKNLWGDLKNLERVRTPKSILEDQAGYLTQATEGELVGEVEGGKLGRDFQYDLNVRVPSLNNYTYTILAIAHSLELYPVRVTSQRPPESINCLDQASFEGAIESILSSQEVKLVLSRLVSQAS